MILAKCHQQLLLYQRRFFFGKQMRRVKPSQPSHIVHKHLTDLNKDCFIYLQDPMNPRIL
ncbi:hypothetical protein Plhal304r1_c014g0053191 [Plasmopara halstedii]